MSPVNKLLTYSELLRFDTFEERFDYLSLSGIVADRTFGGERWLNQDFYRSYEWKRVRTEVLARDYGCDLGVPGFELYDKPIIHHMNPMTPEQIAHGDMDILDPEYLITVSLNTHNAIHFGNRSTLSSVLVERTPGDTDPWHN